MKRLSAALLAVLLFPLSGCMEATPIDEFGYVLSVGVDEGETERFSFSFLIQQDSSADEAEAGAGADVISAEGGSIYEAISIAQLGVAYKLNFSRTNYIAIAKSAADEGLLEEFLESNLDELGIRRSVKVIIVLGKCSDYFNGLNSKNMPNVSKRQFNLFESFSGEGVIPMTNLTLLLEAVNGGRFDAVLAIGAIDSSIESDEGEGSEGGGSSAEEMLGDAPSKGKPSGGESPEEGGAGGDGTTAGFKREGGLKSYSRGCAAMDGMRIAGVLDGEDSEVILMATGRFDQGRLGYIGKDGYYDILIKSDGKPETELDTESMTGSVRLGFVCTVEMDTAGNAGEIWESELREALEDYLEEELSRVFHICRDMNSDAMGFGKTAAMHFKTLSEWKEFAWKEKYPLLETTFTVSLKKEYVEADGLEEQN